MSHSPLFDRMLRSMHIALFAQKKKISTSEAMERVAAAEARRRETRREFLTDLGRVAAAGALATVVGGAEAQAAKGGGSGGSGPKIGIVGAGLAGLTCGFELQGAGVDFQIFEASTRVGGRQFSSPADTGVFRSFGQSCELGGELIDTGHHMMRNFANLFGLELELEWGTPEGDTAYYFGGQHYPESDVVDAFRQFVDAMKSDVQSLSAAPDAFINNAFDRQIDGMSLAGYLTSRGVPTGSLLYNAIEQAYIAEYGLAIAEQSPLNFLVFMRADNRSKFRPFGVSNEKYHVIGGNDQISGNEQRGTGLAGRLAGKIAYGKSLAGVRQIRGGGVELRFTDRSKQTFAAVVIAIPFTVLRQLDLTAAGVDGGALPDNTKLAINTLGYGNNAKMMIGFRRSNVGTARPWHDPQATLPVGSSGASYSDQAHHQTTWEASPSTASDDHAIIVDYSGAARGKSLLPKNLQSEAAAFVSDLDNVFPRAKAAADAAKAANGGNYLGVIQPWPNLPLTQGSYTCYKIGQFTTIADVESVPVGNVHFAGEHSDSFYSWQGFMEGACLSGDRAANEILADIKAKKI